MIIGGTNGNGSAYQLFTYVTQILMSLMMISFVFIMCIISRASIARISEVLNEQPDICDGSGKDVL